MKMKNSADLAKERRISVGNTALRRETPVRAFMTVERTVVYPLNAIYLIRSALLKRGDRGGVYEPFGIGQRSGGVFD